MCVPQKHPILTDSAIILENIERIVYNINAVSAIGQH